MKKQSPNKSPIKAAVVVAKQRNNQNHNTCAQSFALMNDQLSCLYHLEQRKVAKLEAENHDLRKRNDALLTKEDDERIALLVADKTRRKLVQLRAITERTIKSLESGLNEFRAFVLDIDEAVAEQQDGGALEPAKATGSPEDANERVLDNFHTNLKRIPESPMISNFTMTRDQKALETSDLTDDSSTVEETKLFEEEEEQVEEPALINKNVALEEEEEEEQPEEENEEADDKTDGGQQEKQGMADANGRPSLGGAVEEGEEAKENDEPGEEEQQKRQQQQHTMDMDDERNGGSLVGNASANDDANDNVDDGNADDGNDDGCSVCPETEGVDEAAAEITTGGKGGRGHASTGQNMDNSNMEDSVLDSQPPPPVADELSVPRPHHNIGPSVTIRRTTAARAAATPAEDSDPRTTKAAKSKCPNPNVQQAKPAARRQNRSKVSAAAIIMDTPQQQVSSTPLHADKDSSQLTDYATPSEGRGRAPKLAMAKTTSVWQQQKRSKASKFAEQPAAAVDANASQLTQYSTANSSFMSTPASSAASLSLLNVSGRQKRTAATKVQFYKLPPLNKKMRRAE